MSSLQTLMVLAGVGQLGIAAASLGAPRVLRWGEQLARLEPLTAQIYRVYGVYIFGSNLCFGLLSVLAPLWLLRPDPLAGAVCGFIALWWGARVLIQLLYYDVDAAPPGWIFRATHYLFTAVFAGLTAVYVITAIGAFGGWWP